MQNMIGGLILIIIGAFGLINWWSEFGLVLRGLIPFAFIVLGLLWIASKYYKQVNIESDEESGS